MKIDRHSLYKRRKDSSDANDGQSPRQTVIHANERFGF